MRQKAFVLFMALSLVLAVTAMAADEKPAAEKAAPEIKYGINVGDNIRPVAIASADGKDKIELEKLQKKTVFLLISSVCTACRTEIREVGENIDKFKSRNVDVYGVLIDMDPKTAVERMGTIHFPLLADSEYKIGNVTNLMSAPSTLIVQGGKILYTTSGYRPGQWKEYLR